MRIAVIGAGGVGGYYGALLHRAHHDVVLFARGDHLRVIRERGLTVRDRAGDFVVTVDATDSVSELRGADVALVAVKSFSLAEVAPVVAALAQSGTVVLPLLNGVDAAERLIDAGVPAPQILGGCTFVSASRVEPGVVEHHSRKERVVVGELDGVVSRRVIEIAGALGDMGVESVASPVITVELWQKFNMICALAAACGLARGPLHHVRDTPLGHLLIERAVREIALVARACGIGIPDDQERATLALIDSLPGTLVPSFVLDVQRGGPTELPVLSGTVARLGKAAGIPTPVHDTAAAVLPS